MWSVLVFNTEGQLAEDAWLVLGSIHTDVDASGQFCLITKFACNSTATIDDFLGMSYNGSKFIQMPNHSALAEREEVKAMLHQTMEPFTASLIRISNPGDLTSLGTAVAKPVETQTLDWTVVPQVVGATPALTQLQSQMGFGPSGINLSQTPILGDVVWQPFMLLMDPVVGYITRRLAPSNAWSLGAPGTASISYSIRTFFPGITVIQSPTVSNRVDFMAGPGQVVNLPVADMTFSQGSWKPYGNYCTCGDVLGTRVFWADGSDSLNATGAKVNNGQSWVVTLTVLIPLGYPGMIAGQWFIETRVHSSEDGYSTISQTPGPAVAAGTQTPVTTLPCNTSGYFSLHLVFEDDTPATLPMRIISTTLGLNTVSSYDHVSLSGQQNKQDIIDQIRVNGSGMLLSNVVTQYSKGGTVYGLQSTAEHPWFYWTQSLSNLTNANTQMRTVQNWDKGLYCFVKPQGGTPLAMETAYFKQGELNRSENRSLPMFRPFGKKSYVVVIIVPPNVIGSTVVYPTAQTTYTVCRAIEFTTMDQFFNVDTSKVATSFYSDYVDGIRSVPQFYENPLHLAAIGGLVAKVAQKVVEWAPKVIKGIGYAVGGAKMVERQMSNKSSSSSAGTSLAKAMRTSRPSTPRSRTPSVSSLRSRSGSRSSRSGATTLRIKGGSSMVLSKAQRKRLAKARSKRAVVVG